jgi:hypothetical protein
MCGPPRPIEDRPACADWNKEWTTGAIHRPGLVGQLQHYVQTGQQFLQRRAAATRKRQEAARLLEARDHAGGARGGLAHPLKFEELRVGERREPPQRIQQHRRQPLAMHVQALSKRRARRAGKL